MGNTIIKGDSDRRINDTILGKRDRKVCRFHSQKRNYEELFSFLKENS